jgi:transcriptional regulator with PAS, ATPase and Fis domain
LPDLSYFDEVSFAVTVCDKNGVIIYMNEKSASTFSKDGGMELIGKSLLDCHPEPARSKLVSLLDSPRVNIYTIEKTGQKKMIYQSPWFENGQFLGLIELSLPLPDDIPHFIRG